MKWLWLMKIPTEYTYQCVPGYFVHVRSWLAKLRHWLHFAVLSRCVSLRPRSMIILYHYCFLLSFIISFFLCSPATISCHFSNFEEILMLCSYVVISIVTYLFSANLFCGGENVCLFYSNLFLEPTCFVVVKKMSSLEEMRVSLGQ